MPSHLLNKKSLFFSAMLRLIFTGLLLGAAVTPVWAQSSAGSVSGLVTDSQGAVVVGSTVKLIDTETKFARTATTNEVGRYTFINVAAGVYDITVEQPGFAQSKVAAQRVEVGTALTIDVVMQLGSTTTTVDVEATAAADLQVMNSTVGSTIGGGSMILLPNLGRDASSLSVLQVGVSPTGNVAGMALDQNTFQLDGGFNNDDMAGTQSSYTPSNGYAGTGSSGGTPSGVVPTPVETVEEIKVGTTNQTADFNGGGGSQIQMVTKRGTDQFRGALYEYYFASDVGAANYWNNNHTPDTHAGLPYTPLPPTHRNRFGGALGGPLGPKFWGGKTYFFASYEGYQFPNATTVERAVPTALLRAGVVQLPNSAGVETPYNLNPYPVTVNGTTYQPAVCSGGGLCDPRGVGISPIVSQLWSKYMPAPNDPTYSGGDHFNTQGYLTPIALPQHSNFGVIRLDHDFGARNHFMSSFRTYSYSQLTADQVDIGALEKGDTFGQATATSYRPQQAAYLVAGLTTTISSNITNDAHFSFLRNYWQWSTFGSQAQLPGLSGALEIGGETAGVNGLEPVNVNDTSTRQRAWDGHDSNYRDDLSALHGNHLLQFGGAFQHNFDYTQRNDNGVTINAAGVVYQLTSGTGITMPASTIPAGLPTSQTSNWDNLYAETLGMVAQSQVEYTRGPNFTLNPIGTTGIATGILDSYNFYATDSWHIKPTLTLTYGLSYLLDMPPYSPDGNENTIVDSDGNRLSLVNLLAEREKAALAGQAYAPTIGFEEIRNVGGTGQKYMYNPFYGAFSPRAALAWSPSFSQGIMNKIFGQGKTVIRGGYTRIYGRVEGVRMVFAPLLGAGYQQAVQCIGLTTAGSCLGPGGANPSTAYRIGVDGLAAPLPPVGETLSQPYYPGVNGNASAADGNLEDPNYRPDRSDAFNFTIQRALSQKMVAEVGYIGRIIKNEFQLVNIDSVPTMMTLGGQTFANAFATLYQELSTNQTIQAQPFFEAALGGANSAYCVNYASCTAAVAAQQKTAVLSTEVYNLWTALNAAPSWTLGRTLFGSPGAPGASVQSQLQAFLVASSLGYGNYNAGFFAFTIKDWHGLTTRSNFTYSKTMGTGNAAQSGAGSTPVDPYNLQINYGPEPYDAKFTYSLLELYQVPFFKDQKGVVGRVLGGWSIAPLFTAQSGFPVQVSIGTGSFNDTQAFGEGGGTDTALENAVLTQAFTGGNSAHYNVVATGAGTSGNASTGGSGMNIFANPAAALAEFRPMILGLDTSGGGAGRIRGFPTWNLDTTISKDIRVRERIAATLLIQVTNILNHFQPTTPTLNIDNTTSFGVVTSQFNTPRQMEFGLRIHF